MIWFCRFQFSLTFGGRSLAQTRKVIGNLSFLCSDWRKIIELKRYLMTISTPFFALTLCF